MGDSPYQLDGSFFRGSFLNSTRGWVGGSYLSNGIIYTTSDGGATWGSLYTGFTQTVAKLQFVNNNEGWGLCSDDFIIKTTNGGNNWAIDFSPGFSVRNFFSEVILKDGRLAKMEVFISIPQLQPAAPKSLTLPSQ